MGGAANDRRLRAVAALRHDSNSGSYDSKLLHLSLNLSQSFQTCFRSVRF